MRTSLLAARGRVPTAANGQLRPRGHRGVTRSVVVLLVLEGQPQLGAEDDLVAIGDVDVLIDHVGDPHAANRGLGRLDRADRGVLPRGLAGADHINYPVHAHCILLASGAASAPTPGGGAADGALIHHPATAGPQWPQT